MTQMSKIIRLSSIIIIFLFLRTQSFAQLKKSDSANIYNNIISNFVNYTVYNYIDKNKSDFIEGKLDHYFIEGVNPVLDTNQHYFFKNKPILQIFPDTNYILLAFTNPNIEYGEYIYDSKHKDLYTSTWSLFHKIYSPLMENVLVAYDPKGRRTLYLSGYMFLDDVKFTYFSKGINENSILNYINAKYYNYLPKDIEVNAKNQKVKFYSQALNKTFEVQISKNKKSIYNFSEILRQK